MSKPASKPLDLSLAVHNTLLVLRRAGPLFVIAALLIVVPGTMASNWIRTHPIFLFGLGATILQPVINYAAALASSGLYVAATGWATAQILDGERVNVPGFLRAGLSRGLPVTAVQILCGMAVMAGVFLLVVPGLIIMTALSFAPYIMAAEDGTLTDAFRRSAAITKGRRWMVFGLLILLTVPLMILNILLFKLTTGFGLSMAKAALAPINLYGVAPLTSALISIPAGVAMTVLYRLFSDGKSTSAETTADVFA